MAHSRYSDAHREQGGSGGVRPNEDLTLHCVAPTPWQATQVLLVPGCGAGLAARSLHTPAPGAFAAT